MGTQHPQHARIMPAQIFDELDDLTFELGRLAEALPSTIEELNRYSPDEQQRLIVKKMHIQNAIAHIRKTIMGLASVNGGGA